MDLSTIRLRLRDYRPSIVDHNGYRRAAVAMILRERGGECEALLIQRSERPNDPWSGHMALPGGRHDPDDGDDLLRTAARETQEEVGIDLEQHGHLLGGLDDIQAIARDRPISLVIRPYVYALAGDVVPRPDGHEVRETVWLPLSHLTRPEGQGIYMRRLDGTSQEFPAFVYRGYTVWGLTYRMLCSFLSLLRE
jgi:8-oxo-dGTP pyrophosphatase MutT (NUDIX family)